MITNSSEFPVYNNSNNNQKQDAFAELAASLTKSLIKENSKVTQDITVGTYNLAGHGGSDEEHERETIQNFGIQTDIIGFQEADPVLASLLMDTHGVYFGSQGNPLFYNKEKFDLVHAEDIEIHDKDHFKDALKKDGKIIDKDTNQRRTTTFMVLRSKQTGALILVSNSHMDHRSSRSHDLHMGKIYNKIDELGEKFDLDSAIEIGDYNSAYKKMDEWAEAYPDLIIGGEDKTDDSTTIDRVYAYGIKNEIDGKPMERLGRANDDDWFPHEMSRKELTITSSKDALEENKDLEVKNYPGVLFFEDADYQGNISMIGFGSLDQYYKHKDWNDTTTSIKMSEGVELTLYQNADSSGKEFTFSESTSNVGKKANDKASSYKWEYAKPD